MLDLVVFSFVGWKSPRNRTHHLVERWVASGNRVLWLNKPELSLGRRANLRPRPVADGLWVADLPGVRLGSLLGQRRWSDTFLGELESWRRPDAPLVVFLQLPGLYFAALRLRADLLVYDVVDAWALRLGPNQDRSLGVEVGERMLAERAGLVLAVSEICAERMRRLGAAPELVPNACTPEDWNQVDTLDPHDALRELPTPRLVYWGGLGDDIDFDALRAAAEGFRRAQFVLVGHPSPAAVAALSELENVHLVGERPYAELASFAAGADALMLPFRLTPFNAARDCLKLYEYLATGRPIVTTMLPCAQRFAEWLHVADHERGPLGFAKACRRAAKDRGAATSAKARRDLAREHSWDAKADQGLALMRARLKP